MAITRIIILALAVTLALTANVFTAVPQAYVPEEPAEELPYASMEFTEDTLYVLLPANASTGYEWTYEIGDPTALECATEEYILPEDAFPGAPGFYVATFRALRPDAETFLNLDYARAWEGEAAETVHLAVLTDGDGFLSDVSVTESTIFNVYDPGAEGEEYTTLAIDGDSLTVRLDGNITTGYEWNVKIGDETVLALESEEYVPDETDELIDGAGGMFVFRFKALAPNAETSLSFRYARGWEDEAIDRLDLSVYTDDCNNIEARVSEEDE